MSAVLDQNLQFDGGVSTADQFSQSRNAANFATTEFAFLLRVNLVADLLAITLQMNADPDSGTFSGWQDVATTSIKVLDLTNSSYLVQTDAAIESSKVRAGIMSGTSTESDLLLQFTAAPASYRLRFQITASTQATVEHILVVP